MLEPIDSYINNTKCNYKDYENIKNFLHLYNSDAGTQIMNEEKLYNMLKYFKIYSKYSNHQITDYGKRFRELYENFKEVEKQRQRYYRNADTNMPNYISNPNYLIATYNRLKRSISNRTQYIILKDAILCLSPVDTEHFVNMLMRKYNSNQIKEIIDKINK